MSHMNADNFLKPFLDVLVNQSRQRDMVVEKCAQLENDIPGKLISAHQRFDISYIVLVFDATNEVGYKGPGFHYPDIKKPPVTGLNLYPCAFSWPECPRDFWPMIVMTMNANATELNTCNKIVPTFDTRVSINKNPFDKLTANIFNFIIDRSGVRND